MQERLQKLLSQWGVASRRQAEDLITSGQVRVNGETAVLGQKADPAADRVEVNGRPIGPSNRPQLHYVLLHKPLGMVSTCFDPQGRPTVLEALPLHLQQAGLYPVGRLDIDSTGALLLTNDGQLTYHLTHPSHDVVKTYQVVVQGQPSLTMLNGWRRGVELDGRLTRPAKIQILETDGSTTKLEIALKEGRNRQIRRVAAQLGHPVVSLHRVAIGPLSLGSLKAGQTQLLTASDMTPLLIGLNLQGYDQPDSAQSLHPTSSHYSRPTHEN